MTTNKKNCIIDSIDKQHIIKSIDAAIREINLNIQGLSDDSKNELIKEYKRTKEKVKKIKPCY